jgi:hypothetical protein
MARVWPNLFVEPSNLTVHIAALRRALGDGLNGHRYLVNIPGRGYRFVAQVRRRQGNAPVSTTIRGRGSPRHVWRPRTFGAQCRQLAIVGGSSGSRDSTKVAGTRGFDRSRRARCPLGRRANRAFFTIDGVFIAMGPRCFRTSSVANAAGYAWSRRSFRSALELIATGRADFGKPKFGRIRFAFSHALLRQVQYRVATQLDESEFPKSRSFNGQERRACRSKMLSGSWNPTISRERNG